MRGRWSTIVGAEAAEDENVIALRAKVRALVAKTYAGSFRALFDHYATNGNPDRAALIALLQEADVGNILTRGMWADGVMARVDTNHDGRISWEEFAAIVGLPEVVEVKLDTTQPTSPISAPGRAALAAFVSTQAQATAPSLPSRIPTPAPTVYPSPAKRDGTFYAMAGAAILGMFGVVTFLREAGTR